MARYGRYSRDSYYPPYVPVAERRRETARLVDKLKKKGQTLNPVAIEGRVIAKTFWRKQWCKNLESYSDYENRLPRGRTYVRNGSVVDLGIGAGEVTALVSGSSIYTVKITMAGVESSKWHSLVKECSGKIDSLIELSQGKFSKGVMEIITQPGRGLFPHPKEIKLSCSCPDYAAMCKHVAAVLYGIGARLYAQSEALFLLRQANHLDLIETAEWGRLSDKSLDHESKKLDADLSSLFDIDLADSPTPIKLSLQKKSSISKKSSTQKKKPSKKKSPKKKL